MDYLLSYLCFFQAFLGIKALLSKLENAAIKDPPKVALLLFCMCSNFSKLVYLARKNPTALICKTTEQMLSSASQHAQHCRHSVASSTTKLLLHKDKEIYVSIKLLFFQLFLDQSCQLTNLIFFLCQHPMLHHGFSVIPSVRLKLQTVVKWSIGKDTAHGSHDATTCKCEVMLF